MTNEPAPTAPTAPDMQMNDAGNYYQVSILQYYRGPDSLTVTDREKTSPTLRPPQVPPTRLPRQRQQQPQRQLRRRRPADSWNPSRVLTTRTRTGRPAGSRPHAGSTSS
jgi:hypothetical protein